MIIYLGLMKKKNKLKKLLEWYEIEGNRLVGEEEFESLTVYDLKKIFNIKDDYDERMLYAYQLEEEHIKKAFLFV